MNKVLIYYLRLVQEYFWMKYFFQIFDLIVLKNGKTKIFTKKGNFTNFHDIKKAHGAEWGSEIFWWI